jgi:hypothetical protein
VPVLKAKWGHPKNGLSPRLGSDSTDRLWTLKVN